VTNIRSTDPINASFIHELLRAARFHLGSRRGVIAIAVAAIIAGAALNWNWLVAVGLAPILIAFLPCAVMCGLGLCMHKMTNGSGGSGATNSQHEAKQALDSVNPERARVTPGALSCCHGTIDERPNGEEPAQAKMVKDRATSG
jgi:hypothetical protein